MNCGFFQKGLMFAADASIDHRDAVAMNRMEAP